MWRMSNLTAAQVIEHEREFARMNADGREIYIGVVHNGGLILVDDSADPFSVEAVRASMGALFTQQIATARWPEFIGWLRAARGQLVGTSLKASDDYLDARYSQPCFLLIGNEQQGLPASYEAECDLLVKIPMAGRADSLNAAVAAGIMAFAIKASWR